MSTNTGALRQAAFKGGLYLAGRQVVSIALKFLGVMVITRFLGPASYGSYVSAFNVYQYVLVLGQAGVGVYLLRHHGEVSEKSYRTAYSMLAMMSLVLTLAMELGRGPLSSWIQVDGFAEVAAIIVLALPFQLMAVPATVMLERALNYKAIALLEILGQICFYFVGVPLVMLHFGPVSLGIAWVLQQAVACFAAYYMSKSYPKFGWSNVVAREIISYATSFSIGNWVWQMRMLLNPMIVGPALGGQAVGLVGMTIGLLEMLSIIKTIAWRLAVAVLGKVQDDFNKLRNAVTEGMEIQTLAVGVILLGFAWTGHIIVPLLFGQRWLPVMDLYPYIAVSYLTIATFNMHSSVMSVINRNRMLAGCFLVHILVFATTAYFCVARFGIVGYGYGELATIPTYFLIHLCLARVIGSPVYRLTAVWWAATVIGLFWAQLGVWAIAVPFVALVLPISLKRLRRYISLVSSKRKPNTAIA